MKRLLYIILLLELIGSCKRKQYDYDVIIIGGGLSGIAASHDLSKNTNSLIIEKEAQLGGRVLTNNFNNKYFYDLGAVYILDSSYFDELPLEDLIIKEQDEIGIWDNDSIYKGADFRAALKSYLPNQSTFIDSLFNNKGSNFEDINPKLLTAFNTNIKSVFPGSIFDYNLHIQQYAKVRYNSSHFLHGNQVVKEKLLSAITSKVLLNSTVTQVDDKQNEVEITFKQNNKQRTLKAKKVIVATNSLVAKAIIKKQSNDFKSFITPISYAPYISIAIGVKDSLALNKFSYIIPIDKGFSAILQQKTVDTDVTIFQLYVASEDIPFFNDMNELKANAYHVLNQIWSIDSSETIFYDQKYWATAGVLANEHYEKDWSKFDFKASKNVYLCGDYCSLNGVPYGMIPAMQTGKKAANRVNKEIR